jgi:hypothetical protein
MQHNCTQHNIMMNVIMLNGENHGANFLSCKYFLHFTFVQKLLQKLEANCTKPSLSVNVP